MRVVGVDDGAAVWQRAWSAPVARIPIVVVRVVLWLAKVEQARREPADRERGNDVCKWNERLDRGFVAQIRQAHTIERDPDDRRREDIEAEVEQVEQNH